MATRPTTWPACWTSVPSATWRPMPPWCSCASIRSGDSRLAAAMSARRVLVTGGAGFIGSHLARALIADGWEVEIADDLSTGSEANLPDVPFHRLDLSREGALDGLGRFDAI